MYVSDKHKYIMIHIQKTGGTAVAKSLLPRTEGRRVDYRHGKLSSIKDWQKYKDYFIFSFVRNPYTRVASRIRFQNIRHDGKYKDSKTHVFMNRQGRVTTVMDFLEFNPGAWLEQASYLEHDNLKMSFVGRFEKLQKDYDFICDRLGVDKKKLPKKNKTYYYGEYDYKDYVKPGHIKFISNYAKRDFKLFNYKVAK